MAPPKARLALSEPVAALALLVLATSCAALLFAQERRVTPSELPSLTLPEAAVLRVLRSDAVAARAAPSSPRARALDALLLEQGRAEARGLEETQRYQDRRDALAKAFRELAAEIGEPVALRLRERSLQKLEAALALELSQDDARVFLGAFPAILARAGASRDGYIVAPQFVVRTLFKARWNLLHGLVPDRGFAAVERRAYYGWQGLHAERVPMTRRVDALRAYALAGGDPSDVDEALGVLLFRRGEHALAAERLQSAYRTRGTIRVRNHLLAAQAAAGSAD